MQPILKLGPGVTPAALRAAMGRLDRHQLDLVAATAIDLLDELDGDADLEEDDPPGVCDEDGFNTWAGHIQITDAQKVEVWRARHSPDPTPAEPPRQRNVVNLRAAAWERALAEFRDAQASMDSVPIDDLTDEPLDRFCDAQSALLTRQAPDVAALALKLEILFDAAPTGFISSWRRDLVAPTLADARRLASATD